MQLQIIEIWFSHIVMPRSHSWLYFQQRFFFSSRHSKVMSYISKLSNPLPVFLLKRQLHLESYNETTVPSIRSFLEA